MSTLTNRLKQALRKRKENGNYRSLKVADAKIDFFSNNYLSLPQPDTEVDFFYADTSSSRLIAGTSSSHIQLEKQLAEKFDSPSALLFNSGYTANLGLLSCLPTKNDLILYDEFAHASLKDGIRLSNASFYKFKHNDISNLERLLKKYASNYETVFVVVESLYSMDGDFCPLKEICQLKKQYEFSLLLDEAHSIGTFGTEGKGISINLDLSTNIDFRIITFGKAFGSHGAAVLANQTTIDYLINFSRPFIYTTALPTNIIQHIAKKINHPKITLAQKKLQNNINYFRTSFAQYNLKSANNSPIQTLFFPKKHLDLITSIAQENGIGIKAILPPTVPKGGERLRISIHSANTNEEIDLLKKCIECIH